MVILGGKASIMDDSRLCTNVKRLIMEYLEPTCDLMYVTKEFHALYFQRCTKHWRHYFHPVTDIRDHFNRILCLCGDENIDNDKILQHYNRLLHLCGTEDIDVTTLGHASTPLSNRIARLIIRHLPEKSFTPQVLQYYIEQNFPCEIDTLAAIFRKYPAEMLSSCRVLCSQKSSKVMLALLLAGGRQEKCRCNLLLNGNHAVSIYRYGGWKKLLLLNPQKKIIEAIVCTGKNNTRIPLPNVVDPYEKQHIDIPVCLIIHPVAYIFEPDSYLDNDGRTCIFRFLNSPTTVRHLVGKGADINHADSYGITPLHLACCSSKFFTTMWYLLSVQADVNRPDNRGRTPLFYACMAGSSTLIVETLLEYGARVDAVDKKGQTALFYTSRNIDAAKVLVEKGGADVNHVDKYEMTPIFTARNTEVVAYLHQKGADIRHMSQNGTLPIVLIGCAADAVASYLLDQYDDAFLDNETDNHGRTLFWHAAQRRNHNIMNRLLQRNVNIDRPDNNKTTPLLELLNCHEKHFESRRSTRDKLSCCVNCASLIFEMINRGVSTFHLNKKGVNVVALLEYLSTSSLLDEEEKNTYGGILKYIRSR